jgi:hypothetical protein
LGRGFHEHHGTYRITPNITYLTANNFDAKLDADVTQQRRNRP